MLPHERKLLTDQQLRDASRDQIEDLVQRLNLILREREEPGAGVDQVRGRSPGEGLLAHDRARLLQHLVGAYA